MRLDIMLEPPGIEADRVLQEWRTASGLETGPDNQIEVVPDRCLAVLVALRSCCYDRGLIVNVKFTTEED